MPQARSTELPELVISGPFGGIQSECGRRQIEDTGFGDVLDVIFQDGQLYPRRTLSTIPAPATTNGIRGIFDFYNFQGIRITGVFTDSGVWKWNSTTSTWTQITGTLTASQNLFSWTVVAGKLCFSQGIDKVQQWDGAATTFGPTDATNAVPAYHLGELNTHLIACPTVEGGTFAPQRIRWTGVGDPTDWTSFSSGESDLFNDLGPITGWKKIYQQGYVFQQWGVVQQVPTGNGSVPWDFVPLSSKSKGLYYPYSLSGYGEFAIYVGKDNVYLFNGSSSQPIGEMPLQGRAWIGARDRILADLVTNGNPNTVYGYYTTSTNGQEFETYILVIPSASVWIYSVKESSWTRIGLGEIVAPPPTVVGSFYTGAALRINQLVGPISSQNWTFIGLANSIPPTDSIAFGGNSGGYVGLFDLSGTPRTCSVTTGSLCFQDTRHSKNVRHVRLTCEAYQAFDVTVNAQNEQGQLETKYFVVAADPGTTSYQVLPFHIPGVFITFTITFNTTVVGAFAISEIAFGYDIGAEVRTQ